MIERNKKIDGLRGIAMIMIVSYHMFYRYCQLFCDNAPKLLLVDKWGVIGTTLFFLISGFFLAEYKTTTLTDSIRWILKKIFRLWPAYIVSITLCFIITNYFGLENRTVGITEYLLNAVFVNGFIGVKYVDSAHWYLTSIIACYICIACIKLVRVKRKSTMLFLWLILNAIFLLLYNKMGGIWSLFLFKLLGSYDCAIVISGIAINWILKNKKRIDGYLLLLSGLVYMTIFQSIMYAFVLLSSIIVLLIVLCTEIPYIDNHVLCWLGAISYSVYVSHQNIGFVLINKFVEWKGYYAPYMSLIIMVVVIAMGCIIYYLVEKPAQKFVKEKYKK